MTEKEYAKLVKDRSPKSPIWKDCFNAFWIGGLICAIGQGIRNGYMALGLAEEQAGRAAQQMGIMGEKVKLIYGLPLAVTGKSPFFDRKPKA